MKNSLNFILARYPKFYEKILKLNKNSNIDKVLFLNLVKNGDIVFDIGANVGYYTILFSHLVGKTGEVHAFEPVPQTFEILSKQIDNQKIYNNVYLNNNAVSDTNGIATMYMPGNDHRQASLKIHKLASWETAKNIEAYECKVIKLDEYMQSKPLKKLDFVKLDVEGAELLALKGFSQSIAKYLPNIYLEIFSGWTVNFQYKPIGIIDFLSNLGYLYFYIVTDKIQPLNNFPKENLEEKSLCPMNLLCTVKNIII